MSSKDKRAFFQVDVGYFDNPKLADLVEDNPQAVILHLRAIAYSAQHLTDGIFPTRLVMRLACAPRCGPQCGSHCQPQCALGLLVQYGLVNTLDDATAEVHDYLAHQRSAESIGKAKAAGQRAAAARWEAETDAEGNADRIADRNAKPMRNPMPRERERKSIKNSSSVIAKATPDQPIREDINQICNHLADTIQANGSKRPTITKRWQDSARLLIDKDEHTTQQITWIIDWAAQDDFWKANILSMPKLREKFDQLRLKATGKDSTAPRPVVIDQWRTR